MSYVLSQFQACPFLPGICRAFVILFWKSSKCPTVGPGVQYTKSLYYLSNISPFRLNHSLIPAQRECLFIQTLQTIHWLFSPHVPKLITMTGSNFLKWNIEKGTTLTASRRMPHPRAEVFWQIPTRPVPEGGGGMGHYCSVFPLTLTFTLLASPCWLLTFTYFLTADIKFSCCFSNEIRLLCFLSLALALSLLSALA